LGIRLDFFVVVAHMVLVMAYVVLDVVYVVLVVAYVVLGWISGKGRTRPSENHENKCRHHCRREFLHFCSSFSSCFDCRLIAPNSIETA
jgi:hypothetical protein